MQRFYVLGLTILFLSANAQAKSLAYLRGEEAAERLRPAVMDEKTRIEPHYSEALKSNDSYRRDEAKQKMHEKLYKHCLKSYGTDEPDEFISECDGNFASYGSDIRGSQTCITHKKTKDVPKVVYGYCSRLASEAVGP